MSDTNQAVQSLNMARGLKSRIQREEEVYYTCSEKTKALISFAVTAKLICVFVFAYAKSRFSNNEAQLWHSLGIQYNCRTLENLVFAYAKSKA